MTSLRQMPQIGGSLDPSTLIIAQGSNESEPGYATVGQLAAYIQELADEIMGDALDASGVASLNGLTGIVTLSAGSGITLTPVGNDIEIAAVGGGSYTDEEAQDAIGTILVDSATIDFTYTDATPAITAATIPAGILAQLLTVDGAGSLLDADKLDGLDSTAFSLSSHTHAHSALTGIGTNTHAQIDTHIANMANPHGVTAAQIGGAAILTELLTVDGSGSLLDADFLDGHDTAYFATAASLGSYQPLDATLTSIALLGTAADKLAYTTGVDTWAETSLTAFGRSLIDDAAASNARTTLGLGTIATEAETNYILKAGTRAFTGNQSMGGNALTSIGYLSGGGLAANTFIILTDSTTSVTSGVRGIYLDYALASISGGASAFGNLYMATGTVAFNGNALGSIISAYQFGAHGTSKVVLSNTDPGGGGNQLNVFLFSDAQTYENTPNTLQSIQGATITDKPIFRGTGNASGGFTQSAYGGFSSAPLFTTAGGSTHVSELELNHFSVGVFALESGWTLPARRALQWETANVLGGGEITDEIVVDVQGYVATGDKIFLRNQGLDENDAPQGYGEIRQAGDSCFGADDAPAATVDIRGDLAITSTALVTNLNADRLDSLHATDFLTSIAKSGSTALHGDVTLSAGSNITLTQVGQDISIASTGSGGAPADAQYVTLATNATLSDERVLTAGTAIGITDAGAGSTVTVAVNDAELLALAGLTSAANKFPYFTGSGTAALADLSSAMRDFLTTPSSANLDAVVTDDTGSGALVFATSPTLVTPVLGVATATSINGLTITSSTGTLTVTNLKTLSVSNSLTLAGTDSTVMTFPTTSATIARTDAANTFTGHQTIEGVTSTGATGTGKFVFDGTPTLVTPVIGVATGTSLAVTGLLKSSSASAGVGYAVGAGSTVTQVTSKAQGVTINALCGTITTHNAALANNAEATFAVTDSSVGPNDVVIVNHASGGTSGGYTVSISAVANTTFSITLSNISGGSLSEALVLNFAVIKAVAS